MKAKQSPKAEPAAPSKTVAPSATPSPQSLLIEWANQQDNWVRALVSEIIETRQELPDARLNHFYTLLLKEKELLPGGPIVVSPLSGGFSGAAAGETFSLTGLDATQNINALVPGQNIQFNPRITIVFGENASGKTGYVRVLKRAAAVRTAETVLPNVTAPTSTNNTPRAKIGFLLGGTPKTADWANEAGLHPFTRMDVFDSSCTLLHLDEDLTYIYTPGELSLFPLVQHGLEKVKDKLESEMKRRSASTNPFLREFERGSRVYTKIEALGPATNVEELRTIATLSDEEQQLKGALAEEIDALRSQTPDAHAKVAQSEQQFLQALGRALEVVAGFDNARYDTARTELIRAREAFDLATRSAFAGLAIPGVLQPEWRSFVQAGEALLGATDRQQYPSANDTCIYCSQRLDRAALELVRKYRDFCNNQLQASVTAAERSLEGIAGPFLQLNVASLQESTNTKLGERLQNGYATVLRGVTSVLTAAAGLQVRLRALEANTATAITADASRSSKEVETLRQEYAELGTDLKRRVEERAAALKEREARLLEINARMRLAERLPDIERFVAEAQWVSKAGIVGKRFQTIFKSLTDASKSASEKLLNQDFEKRFRDECKRLRAPEVKLLFPGRQGQVARRKSVSPDHRLREILSEGEQKVIALADFLAEVALKPKAPVVFDDPVNSLDYRRMAELVDRLVQLSQDRQVIIFTHNIWFTTELLSRFEKNPNECSYYDVQGDPSQLGLVTKGSHPRSDTYKTLRGKLNTVIQSAEKATGEAQTALIEKGYEYLRSICEVIVESELLQGVTQRYQPNVMMTRLPNIKFDRLREAAEAILPVFEKCCRCIASHSQPLETLNVRPSLSELKADLKTVEDARAKYIQ
jgi:hypothetical protein